MFKTNIVIDEKAFLSTYLKTLIGNSKTDARRFIVINYTLFAGREFLENLIDQLYSEGRLTDLLPNVAEGESRIIRW